MKHLWLPSSVERKSSEPLATLGPGRAQGRKKYRFERAQDQGGGKWSRCAPAVRRARRRAKAKAVRLARRRNRPQR